MILKGWEMENSSSIYFVGVEISQKDLYTGMKWGEQGLREMEGCEVHNEWGIYFFSFCRDMWGNN